MEIWKGGTRFLYIHVVSVFHRGEITQNLRRRQRLNKTFLNLAVTKLAQNFPQFYKVNAINCEIVTEACQITLIFVCFRCTGRPSIIKPPVCIPVPLLFIAPKSTSGHVDWRDDLWPDFCHSELNTWQILLRKNYVPINLCNSNLGRITVNSCNSINFAGGGITVVRVSASRIHPSTGNILKYIIPFL